MSRCVRHLGRLNSRKSPGRSQIGPGTSFALLVNICGGSLHDRFIFKTENTLVKKRCPNLHLASLALLLLFVF